MDRLPPSSQDPERRWKRVKAMGLVGQRISGRREGRLRISGQSVLSFVSADYLGLSQHPALIEAMESAGRGWGLSLGTPRVLASDSITERLEQRLAELVGAEQAIVFPSTLHITMDVLPILAGRNGLLLLDHYAYPISVSGAQLARSGGAIVRRFHHNDVEELRDLLRHEVGSAPKVVVVDGVYSCGATVAALRGVADAAMEYGAWVYVDDAHGIGVLGWRPTRENPLGSGGAGTPAWCDVRRPNVLHVASLAKALAVPLAFIAGPARIMVQLRRRAPSLEHSSPPVIPVVAAAGRALDLHAASGGLLRRRLMRNVDFFRRAAGRLVSDSGGEACFPILTVRFKRPATTLAVAAWLRSRQIWPVVQVRPPDVPNGSVLRFLLTAQHRQCDLQRAIVALRMARKDLLEANSFC